MISSEDANGQLRDALNTRLTEALERGWPTIHREMTRMARGHWERGPQRGTQREPRGLSLKRHWELTTTMRLLEAPAPSEIEVALGIASAVAHVEARRHLRGAIEAWTLTLRAYADHDEAQVTGAQTEVSRDVSPDGLRRLLRAAALTDPGYYPLNALTSSAPARDDQHASEV